MTLVSTTNKDLTERICRCTFLGFDLFWALSHRHLFQITSSGKDRVQFQNLLNFKVWILFHHMKALSFQQSHDFHDAALVAIVNFNNSLQALKTLISRNVKSND